MRREGLCPRCRAPLSGSDHQGVVTLVCPACRGLFLRGKDLRSQFGPAVHLIESAERALDQAAAALACPAGCRAMRRRFVPAARGGIHVDVCPVCDGVWLDHGEVRAILDSARKRSGLHARRRPAVDAAELTEEATGRVSRSDIAVGMADSDDPDQKDSWGWWIFSFVTQLPLEGYNPVQRTPFAVWGLMAVCVALFGVQLSVGHTVIEQLGLVPRLLVEEHDGPARMIASMFLHGDWLHLLGNLYFLKVFGDNVEDRLGRVPFLVFYVACGLAADFAHVTSDRLSTIPTIGASGAIAGCLGAYLVLFPGATVGISPSLFTLFRVIRVGASLYLPWFLIWQVIAAQLYPRAGIAWWAHIGGFVAGMILALLMSALLPDARVAVVARRIAAERGSRAA